MKYGRTVRVGAFVAVGLLAVLAMMFFLGRSGAVFLPKVELYARFTNVSGLLIGSPVRLGGINVGMVDDIGFAEDPAHGVIVELSVDERYQHLIRQDSVAELATMGLLGDMLVNISLGSEGAPPIEDGATLATRELGGLQDLMASAQTAVQNVERITQTLDDRLETVLTDELAADLGRLANASADIAEAIAYGDGLAHDLLHDPELAASAAAVLADARRAARRIDRSAARMESMLASVERGDGLLHGLIYGKGGEQTIQELTAAAGELRAILAEVRSGDGLLHSLVYEDDAANLLENLTETSRRLDAIVAGVEQGKGTFGGLLRDPSIYRDLKGILGEVRRNSLLKALVRLTIDRDGLVRAEPEGDDEDGGETGPSALLRDEPR